MPWMFYFLGGNRTRPRTFRTDARQAYCMDPLLYAIQLYAIALTEVQQVVL